MNDWSVKRFILDHKNDTTNAFKVLVEAMKWRKTFGINDLSEEDFPREFFENALVFPCGLSKHGYSIIYIRAQMVNKLDAFSELHKRFYAFVLNKLDIETNGSGICIIGQFLIRLIFKLISVAF